MITPAIQEWILIIGLFFLIPIFIHVSVISVKTEEVIISSILAVGAGLGCMSLANDVYYDYVLTHPIIACICGIILAVAPLSIIICCRYVKNEKNRNIR